MNEIKLYENSKERDLLEDLSDLYSIFKTTDLLEAAYSRDAITPAEYAEACNRFITQFKATEKGLIHSNAIVDAASFYREYDVDCPRAYHRLIEAGLSS